MIDDQVILKTQEFVRNKLDGESTGHDWWHVFRVWRTSCYLAKMENANLYVVQLAALLHDIADWKFHNGDESIGPKVAKDWLNSLEVDQDVIIQVVEIIKQISFKGAKVKVSVKSIEAMIVQDADRLDAIGAIGIARAFAYGGKKGRKLFDPLIKPELHASSEHYKSNKSPTINHFYEKLLLLRDLMNTEAAKKIAEIRHQFLQTFLVQFSNEWECKDFPD